MARKNMKSSASSVIDVMEGLDPFNISSNGRDTQKVITPGNRLCRFTPQTLSKPTTASAH
jgi:hypothetical protein